MQTQADGPAAEISATLTYSDWSVTAWYGRELKDAKNSELDLLISPPGIKVSDTVTLDSTVGIYFLPGDDAFVAEAGISMPVVDGWKLRASYQGVRGGFTENLAAVELQGEIPLSENLALNVTPAVFYSDYARSAGASLAVGVTYQADDRFGIRAFALGYVGGTRSDIAFGVSLVVPR